METTKEAYKEKMEAQLKLWNAKLDGVKAKADKATAEAKIGLLKQVDALKVFEVAAKKHLAEVEAAAADGWNNVRDGFEQKWNQLTGSVEAMWDKISPDTSKKN